MTVADNTSRNQYTATSGQTVFAYTFEIVDKDDVVVLKNGTTLSEGTDYTVANVGNDSGGNVTLTVGATAGDILTLYRDMPYSRTQNYTNSGDFLASEVNSDFDNLWLAGEQTNRAFSQSIRKPITDSDSISMELPEAADRANKFVLFDSTGAVGVESVSSGTGPTVIGRQQFTGDGTTTVFTLAATSSSAAAVIYIDGVYQEQETYTVVGTTLTFTEAPPTNASIEVLAYKITDIGTTDANAVTYTPAGTGAVQTTVQTKLRESVSVKDFGAVGDGVTDDAVAIQAALDAYQGTEVFVHFPEGTYLTSANHVAYQQKISSDNAVIACSVNTGIALTISGGAFFFELRGKLTVTRATPYTGVESQISGAYGVKIKCRADIQHLLSRGHYWDGVNINSTSNLNKSRYYTLESKNNARHGIYFDGTQDDTSVWRVNFDCGGNYASGIYFEDTSPARQFYGFGYTEDNCADGISYGAYLGGLTASEMFIYSEEQTSNLEINMPAAGDNNVIYSGRGNNDINSQPDSRLIRGSATLHFGATGSILTDRFINLNDNPAKYWDLIKTTSNGDLFQDRHLGSGETWKSVMDAGLSNYTEWKQSPSSVSLNYSNGTIDSNTRTVASDAWSFNFTGNTGTATRTQTTNFVSLRTAALTVGGGNKGTGILYIGTANATSSTTDRLSIYYSNISPQPDNAMSLGTASKRWTQVFAVAGTINTSDDREKTYLDIEAAEKACALEIKENLRKFKWNESIDKKGDSARIHFGASAQTVKAIFESHGLDAHNYGLFCYDEWDAISAVPATIDKQGNVLTEEIPATPAGNRYGIRYEELLCFIMAAL